MMIHDLDMARFLLGEEPVEVYAAASVLVDAAIGAAGDVDTAVVVLRTASGRIVPDLQFPARNLRLRPAHRGARRHRPAAGREHDRDQCASWQRATASPPTRRCRSFWNATPRAYRAELDAFVDAVEGMATASPNGADGLASLVLADAATELARSGKPVRPG